MSWIVVILLAIALMLGSLLGGIALTAASSQATPVAQTVHGSALARLLDHLPNLPLGVSGGTVTFADPAQQAAALGLTPPPAGAGSDMAQPWLDATRMLNLPQSTGQFWALPEWREAYGFGLEQVDQVVEYSAPPLTITIVQGRFDPDELRAAWERGGYQPVDLGRGEAFAVRDDFQIDVAKPDSRMAMANLNVVALTGDDTLIFSSAREGVRAALAAAAGEAPSFAERPDIAPLVRAAPPELVSALLIDGSLLQAAPDPAGILIGDESPADFATRTATEQDEARALPPVGAALLGQTVGHVSTNEASSGFATPMSSNAPSGTLVAILTMGGEDAARQGAETIARRLDSGESPALMGERLGERPWSEMFPDREVRAVDGEPAVLIELQPAPGLPPFLLQSMVFQRTPGFLAWSR